MRRAFQWITIGVLCLGLGLHWAALQTVAWTSMVIARAPQVGLTEAVSTTFDGQHPCRLCLVVREGRAADRPSPESPVPATGITAKLDLAPASTPFELVTDATALPPAAIALSARPSRSDPPPRPPPRSA